MSTKYSNSTVEEIEPVVVANASAMQKYVGYGSVSMSTPRSNPHQIQTYRRRWWILFAFCLCCVAQSAQWNVWGPISDAVQITYNWNPSVVALIPAISNGSFTLFGFAMMFFIETNGLRYGIVTSACLLMSVMAFWNVAVGLEQSWLVVLGSACNGIAASCTMAAPPLLSVTWFPLNERTTATAVAAAASYIGSGLSFLVGPSLSTISVSPYDLNHRVNLSSGYVHQLTEGVLHTIYFNTGIIVICFLCVLIYFPANPPTPPSVSADADRVDFWTGLRQMVRNLQFCLLLVAFNLPNGSFTSWISMISVNFRDMGISQITAGWMGFVAIMSGCAASIFLSVFIDYFKRKMKLFVQLMSLLSIVNLVALVCIQERYIHIPGSALTVVLYILVVSLGVWINGAIPLYYELGCEIAYPVHEGLSCSFLTIINNFCEMLYLLIFLNPTLAQDTRWMTWTLLGTCVVTLPMLLLLRESFARLDLEDED